VNTPDHRLDPESLLTLCIACKTPVRAGCLTEGLCPECPGVRACRHCLGVTEELDATGHCEGCCDGTFIPASARVELDDLADAQWSRMVAEDTSPALDALPWECWWAPAAEVPVVQLQEAA
jgi:hypothetical protein